MSVMTFSPELKTDDPGGSITILYREWRRGNQESFGHLLQRFRPRLLALAHSSLLGRVRRVADAEDAFQSAVISFWKKAERGDLSLSLDREGLWGILGVITVRKALRLLERESAQKRGGRQQVSYVGVESAAAVPQGDCPEMLFAEMLELLDEDLRPFAILRLAGHSYREIAEELDCTEKKVERKLKLIRTIWEEEVVRWSA
jgi:RNA polymerase sigma factor (sigma-70 family)